MAELRYWVWLSTRKGIGARAMGDLLRYYGSPEEIYFVRKGDYPRELNINSASLEDKTLSPVSEILGKCSEMGYTILTLGDAAYPARLKNIYDPPVVLYVDGKLPLIDEEIAVNIVGTRDCTPYGIKISEQIGYEVTKMGGLVISGLARGIDSAAARGALRANGKVVGVLGCGIDVVYPPSNERLFWDVKHFGALVSEYPPGVQPDRGHFPARNRIMSGLSLGVVVAEAPERSGALITASMALEQGKDVFAVPGNVDASSCRGSNNLLKEGAQPVTCGRDIMEVYSARFPDRFVEARKLNKLDERGVEILAERELGEISAKEKVFKRKTPKKAIDKEKSEDYINVSVRPEGLSPDEEKILEVMSGRTMHVDDIIEVSGIGASKVLATLTLLEIAGVVKQEPGKRFTALVK
ncbi:MAG: DNA-processing protein DprA [Oscillospiraceae bacterium]|nr:DNA-processing protein DprA [Oscillospiraceae bacterium]